LQHQITLYLVRAAQIKGSRGSGPFSGPSVGPGPPRNWALGAAKTALSAVKRYQITFITL